LSAPRRKSKRGGLLPNCRHISLTLGSKPIFDRNYNNYFVTFGQLISHDMAMNAPVTDKYNRPISTCKCKDNYDSDRCFVIDVPYNDPYLYEQKCMALAASAQAFKNEVCSLGVKQLKNGNSHFLDASYLYGSTKETAKQLMDNNGRLKSSKVSWSAFEMPPSQTKGQSCNDANDRRKCFAGGKSFVLSFVSFHMTIVQVILV
jgi:peroxidase